MAGMLSQLLEILNEQAERYGELLGLSREKKDVIIKNDVETLQKITHLENLIVSQNQKLEKKRAAVIKDMASVLGKKEDELTISALAELMDGREERRELEETGERIRGTLAELAEINAHNASLITNALDYIEFSINLIRSSADPSFYTAAGERLADGRGIIDARH